MKLKSLIAISALAFVEVASSQSLSPEDISRFFKSPFAQKVSATQSRIVYVGDLVSFHDELKRPKRVPLAHNETGRISDGQSNWDEGAKYKWETQTEKAEVQGGRPNSCAVIVDVFEGTKNPYTYQMDKQFDGFLFSVIAAAKQEATPELLMDFVQSITSAGEIGMKMPQKLSWSYFHCYYRASAEECRINNEKKNSADEFGFDFSRSTSGARGQPGGNDRYTSMSDETVASQLRGLSLERIESLDYSHEFTTRYDFWSFLADQNNVRGWYRSQDQRKMKCVNLKPITLRE